MIDSISQFFDIYTSNIIASVVAFVIVTSLIFASVKMGDWIGGRLDRHDTSDRQRNRLLSYGKWAIRIVSLYILLIAVMFLLRLWTPEFHENISPEVRKTAKFFTRQFFTAGIFLAIWEGCYFFLRKKILHNPVSAKQRMLTLFPIAVNVLTIVLSLFWGFTFLSAIGIDIAPLLTGAGVAGIAVGLAAQQSIRDLISGVTIIFEDLIQVGDVVKLGEHGGLVERITLRKIQLRDYGGTVFTVPNGEIKVIENMTKGFSYALFNISVAYDTDMDVAFAAIQKTYDDMKKVEKFDSVMIEPIDIAGVDAFGDSAIVIKARIKTLPIQQWNVMREFNRVLKLNFEAAGVEIPFPQRVLHYKPVPVSKDTISGDQE